MKKLISVLIFTFSIISLNAQRNLAIQLKMYDTLSSRNNFAFFYSIKNKNNKCFYAIENFQLKYNSGCDINLEIDKQNELGEYVPYQPYLPSHFDPYYGMQKRDIRYCKEIKLTDSLFNIIYRIDKGKFRARIYYYDKINLNKIKFKRIAESNWYYFIVPKIFNFSGF